jgi:hypothetical protein
MSEPYPPTTATRLELAAWHEQCARADRKRHRPAMAEWHAGCALVYRRNAKRHD